MAKKWEFKVERRIRNHVFVVALCHNEKSFYIVWDPTKKIYYSIYFVDPSYGKTLYTDSLENVLNYLKPLVSRYVFEKFQATIIAALIE